MVTRTGGNTAYKNYKEAGLYSPVSLDKGVSTDFYVPFEKRGVEVEL